MTTPREALLSSDFLVTERGTYRHFYSAEIDAILTALAPHLKTPHTLEICPCERQLVIGHDEDYGFCQHDNCPIRKATK